MIDVQHITKRYRKQVAVDDLSFTVETGKVTGFLGPNGAGKSTTMRLMLGLDNGSGTTTFDGKPLHRYQRPAQAVGILLEAKAFHPTRTAKNHLEVLAIAGGISTKRVNEVLDIVGLSSVAKKKPGKFSLGMSQRLGIAAAILGEPKYLLLDEPANGLDPEGIAWLREFIKEYAAKDRAVFISSHLLSEMSQMADNLVVIGKGKLIADTTMANIISGSSHSGVFIRTPKASVLERALRNRQLTASPHDGGFTISGATTDEIGKLAFEVGVPIYELTAQVASLEEAFFELTADSQEYKAGALPQEERKN